MMLKKFKKLQLNLVPILICFYSVFAQSAPLPQSLDKVIAVVNSQVITESQLHQQMKLMQNQLAGSHNPLSTNLLRKKVLEQLIDNCLQLDVAKKANIQITDIQVDQAIAHIAAQNHISPLKLIQSVQAQGLTETAYRHKLGQELLIHEVQQKMVAPDVVLTPQDLTAAAVSMSAQKNPAPAVFTGKNSQYHIIDILVNNQKHAEQLLIKLHQAQRDHKPIARILSQEKNVQAADLGMKKLNDLPNLFIKTVKNMSKGEFSAPIQAPNGSHILFLAGGRNLVPPITYAPPLTTQQIAYEHKFNAVLQQWLTKLRNQSYIKIIQ